MVVVYPKILLKCVFNILTNNIFPLQSNQIFIVQFKKNSLHLKENNANLYL